MSDTGGYIDVQTFYNLFSQKDKNNGDKEKKIAILHYNNYYSYLLYIETKLIYNSGVY